MDPVDAPRCANQVYVKADRSPAEASVVCSCPAGLIHMHDCPVTAGLLCRHFQPFDEAAEQPPITVREEEALRDRLMGDFLSRPYYHRVRSLAPQGDAWHRRRAELLAFYAEDDPGPDPSEEQAEARYEEERERLIAQRKRREEAAKERDALTREEKAKERARLGIKTVVERAREAVADRGNVASSFLDDVALPANEEKKRRRR
jgi:hypothetical protein